MYLPSCILYVYFLPDFFVATFRRKLDNPVFFFLLSSSPPSERRAYPVLIFLNILEILEIFATSCRIYAQLLCIDVQS